MTATQWLIQSNPADGSEPATWLPPWANTGMIDLDVAGQKRILRHAQRHSCEPCEVAWNGDELACFMCGGANTRNGRSFQPTVDSSVRAVR